jgi:hypothetical protein
MSLSGQLANRNGGKTSEQGLTQTLSAFLGYNGVIASGDLLVTAQGTPNKTVAVAVGNCIIGSLSPSASTYSYECWLPTTGNITIANNTSGSARIDVIVAYVNLSVVSSSSNDNPGAFLIDVVAGTPSGSPVAPNNAAIESYIGASNPFIVLANIAVANGFSSIITANITDVRPKLTVNGSSLAAGTVPFNLFGAAASTGGGNPPAVGSSNFLMQAGKTTVTTNSHGNATINFPNSFPNGLLCFLPVIAGPSNTTIGLQVIDDSNTYTNASFATIWAWNTPDGTSVNTGDIDILWIAIGW